MERILFKNVLSMIVCTFVNKVHNLEVKSSKAHVMNFELRGYTIQNVDPKK